MRGPLMSLCIPTPTPTEVGTEDMAEPVEPAHAEDEIPRPTRAPELESTPTELPTEPSLEASPAKAKASEPAIPAPAPLLARPSSGFIPGPVFPAIPAPPPVPGLSTPCPSSTEIPLGAPNVPPLTVLPPPPAHKFPPEPPAVAAAKVFQGMINTPPAPRHPLTEWPAHILRPPPPKSEGGDRERPRPGPY